MGLLRERQSEVAFSMVETLVSIVLLGIMALGVANSSIFSMKMAKRGERSSIAAQLALARLEEFASIDPSTLDDDFDENTTGIEVENISFTRNVDVTENADGSRTVTVTVFNEEESLGGRAIYSSTFFLWEDS